MVIAPHPPRRALHDTPAQNHPRKLCLRGARCGGGHSDISPFVPLPRCDISHGAVGILVRWLVFYSMAQAWSNTYEPVLSLHLVTACAGGIILFRPGICPCWWQFPIADHRVIHRRRMFVNLECLDRLLHRPLRKSRPDLPFHICNH